MTISSAIKVGALVALTTIGFASGQYFKGKAPGQFDSLLRVKSCHDGDTCTVVATIGGEALTFRVRLAGIDAPEVPSRRGYSQGQPFGAEATQRLNGLIAGETVTFHQIALDPFNRPVLELLKGSSNIGLTLISEGLAEVYRHPSPGLDDALYQRTEISAKQSRRGIWSLATRESPTDFRRQHAR